MRSRSPKLQLLLGAMVCLAPLALMAARQAAAETLDLSAVSGSEAAQAADGEDLAFLADPQQAAPSTPAPEEPAGKVCKTNSQCGKGEWCAKPDGACKGEGNCKHKPIDCVGPDDPVCGCDHKDYKKACFASFKGVNVDYKGMCKKKGGY
jgi:hypothetical protein